MRSIDAARYQSCRVAGDKTFGHSMGSQHDINNSKFAKEYEAEMARRGFVMTSTKKTRFVAILAREIKGAFSYGMNRWGGGGVRLVAAFPIQTQAQTAKETVAVVAPDVRREAAGTAAALIAQSDYPTVAGNGAGQKDMPSKEQGQVQEQVYGLREVQGDLGPYSSVEKKAHAHRSLAASFSLPVVRHGGLEFVRDVRSPQPFTGRKDRSAVALDQRLLSDPMDAPVIQSFDVGPHGGLVNG